MPAWSSPGAPHRGGGLPVSEPGLDADTHDLVSRIRAGVHRSERASLHPDLGPGFSGDSDSATVAVTSLIGWPRRRPARQARQRATRRCSSAGRTCAQRWSPRWRRPRTAAVGSRCSPARPGSGRPASSARPSARPRTGVCVSSALRGGTTRAFRRSGCGPRWCGRWPTVATPTRCGRCGDRTRTGCSPCSRSGPTGRTSRRPTTAQGPLGSPCSTRSPRSSH